MALAMMSATVCRPSRAAGATGQFLLLLQQAQGPMVAVRVIAAALARCSGAPGIGGGAELEEGEALGVERAGIGGDHLDRQDGLDRVARVERGEGVEGDL